MEPANAYADVVSIYIGLVRQDSLQAATVVERIQATVGSRAALRTALILTIFRMELKQHRWIPDLSVYAYLIQDYPEAVPLLEYAMGCCLQAWGVYDFSSVDLQMTEPARRILKNTR